MSKRYFTIEDQADIRADFEAAHARLTAATIAENEIIIAKNIERVENGEKQRKLKHVIYSMEEIDAISASLPTGKNRKDYTKRKGAHYDVNSGIFGDHSINSIRDKTGLSFSVIYKVRDDLLATKNTVERIAESMKFRRSEILTEESYEIYKIQVAHAWEEAYSSLIT